MSIIESIKEFIGNAQLASAAYYPSTPYKGSLPAKTVKKGSKGTDTKAVQSFLNWCIKAGLAVDGVCGAKTLAAIKRYQKQYKLAVDGVFGPASKKKAQEIINKHSVKPAPAPDPKPPTLLDKLFDACKTQADWMKGSKYKWQSNPTVEKSKKYGTCVTYVACVLQRLGYLKPGECIWHNSKGQIYGTNDKMTVTYYGKTLKQLKGVLKAGDIVIDGKKSVISAGDTGSHIYILTGNWKGDKPIIWDNHSGQQQKGAYAYGRNRNVIAVVRLK